MSTPGYDFHGALISNEKLLGVRLTTDAENNVWFDPAMQTLPSAVDEALPGTINLLTVPSRAGSPYAMVESYSDQQPSIYRLYDANTGELDPVGFSYPKIEPAQMGKQQPIRFKARDGLEIPGLADDAGGPARTKPAPWWCWCSGGPYVRGNTWGWDPETQFLASRGYAVLETEYRGSPGYGAEHFEGRLEAMGPGHAERHRRRRALGDRAGHCRSEAHLHRRRQLRRVCRADGPGEGSGSYQCAVNWAGVTDINLMYSGVWEKKSDTTESFARYGMPKMIGDQTRDAAQLKATSPIEQAARIQKPLLLAYGGKDKRVPLEHGQRFYDVVRKTNKKVEWVLYRNEGHGWSDEDTSREFWWKVQNFLEVNIGQK